MDIEEVLTKVQYAPGHIPVMVREILQGFEPLRGRENLRSFDGTFGRGGHFRAMKAMFDERLQSVVMDQDTEAITVAQNDFRSEVESGKLRVIHGNFSQISDHDLGTFDMMLLDLGVSSPQLDQGDRGFSFYQDGPLDMRMDQEQSLTAETLLNTATEEQLIRIFQDFGEVRRPFRVVRAVMHDRKEKAFQSTRELAGLIERVDGWRVKGVHPATQYFMALRLAVNDELGVLREGLPHVMKHLKDGGRLAVLTFHSLEDRIVKHLFREPPLEGFPVQKRVIIPSDEECRINPRARSAKLRIFQRGAVQDERRRYR